MTGVSRIFAAILLIAGVVLAALAYYLVRRPAPPPVAAPAPVAQAAAAPVEPPVPQAKYPVVLAATDIQAGTRLEPDMLKVEQWPVALSQGYAQPEALAGEVARLDIAAGEPVTNQLLAQGLSKQLRSGERAVAVPVDEVSGAGNRVMPGDLVDVFFALKKSDEVAGSQVRLLQSRVRVLAYGAQTVDGPPATDAKSQQRGAQTQTQTQARSAILAVPVSDVNELMLASKSGQLQLALRSPVDDEVPDRQLFVARQPVMPTVAGLTAEQRDQLNSGVNRAYAGESLAQLDRPAEEPAKRQAARSGGTGRTIEIVRGDSTQHVRY
ncbi:Flp pilus assembly protein CpaB [Bordetella sp. 02P26C-1]|nr:Flp pilus assembly protein CpaB [Bordetella sp. 02P26C-1]